MFTSHRAWLLATAFSVAACDSGPSAPNSTDTFGGSPTATSVDVNMPGVVYNPNHIDIAQDGVVRFVFTAVAHDVRFNGAAGAPTDVQVTSNATVTRAFANKGTFNFLCTLHSNMTGVVVVH